MRERSHPRPDDEPKEEPPKKGLLKKLAEHPLAKPLLVAGALHLPLQKDVGSAIERAAHATKEAFTNAWEREHMVLDPQSAEQKAAVATRVSDRESRIDRAALAAYKAETEKKLEAGEGPSFKRMQFDLERHNGVPAGEVAAAENKADALIAKYAAEVGDDLDEDELRRISTELYGPDKAYDWGQASVTRYFNNGDRNCVAVARSQGIVFEGVLAKIPADKRKHWRLTTQLVKQHEIAGLEHVDDAGNRDALYLLEGKATRKWVGAENEPGTATLPMEAVMKALVSAAPVEVKAAGKPGEVKASADIAVVTDEPAKLNVKIDGPLKASDFVVREAAREGVEPRKMTEAELAALAAQEAALKDQVMEVQLLTEPSSAEVVKRLVDTPAIERIDPWTGQKSDIVIFDATDLESPDAKTIGDVGKTVGEMGAGTTKHVWRVRYGTMEHWQQEAARQAIRENSVGSISVKTLEGGRLSPTFLGEYGLAVMEDAVGPTNVKIEYGGKDQKLEGGRIDPADLRALLSGKGRRTIDISEIYIDDFEKIAEVIRDMPEDKTVVMPAGMNYEYKDRDAYHLFSKTRGKVMMPYYAYGRLIAKHPDMLDNRHFLFNTASTQPELESLRKIIAGIRPDHPLLQSIDILKRTHEHLEGAGMYKIGDEQGHVDPFELLSVDGE